MGRGGGGGGIVRLGVTGRLLKNIKAKKTCDSVYWMHIKDPLLIKNISSSRFPFFICFVQYLKKILLLKHFILYFLVSLNSVLFKPGLFRST